ncbi:very large A-kinase anchor protein [Paroedura picta]|uniref:very large A-kinase anchor protein n=1 Tax=Paroedura picta TaxID=143630 RepID=UPI0040571EBD
MSAGSSRRRAGSSWHSSFSRLFHRSASKEPEEEGKGAPQETGSFEVKEIESTNVAYRRKESSPLPDLAKISGCENKNLSTEELSRSPTWEELKKANSLPSLAHEGKTAVNGRQPKEGFLQFLGNLFGIASKSSWKETDQSIPGDGSRTSKDFGSPAIQQNDAYPEPEVFGFSVSKNAREVSDKAEEKNTCSGVQEAQGKNAEASKKTDCELGTPAVTYATYRGSARIKQLLKKQVELEQEKEAPTSSISSTPKNNETVDLPELESTARKAGLSLKETKDDTMDAQMNPFLAEMDLKNNAKDISESSDNREPNNAITLLAEMETMKNCIKDVVSAKHDSASKIPEVNMNLLLESVLLPKEASSSCQNIGSVKLSSANNRLVEKGEEVLGETETQLQPNNAAIVDFQKGMCSGALSNTEKIQHEFSSYPKVYSFDDGDEQQLIKSKCSCDSYIDNQFNLKSDDRTLYLNNHLCSGQEPSSIENGNKGSHKHITQTDSIFKEEQIAQITSSNAHLPLYRQGNQEELHDVECNKTSTVTGEINSSVSVQFPETVQEVEIHSKNTPKDRRTTESTELTQINPNFTMIAEINCDTVENFCMPSVKGGHVDVTSALPKIAQVSNTTTCPLSVVCENEQHCMPCTSLENEDDTTGKAVAPEDNSSLILETKGGSCHYPSHRNDGSLAISTGSAITAKPSCLQTAEVMVNNLSISTGKNDPLAQELTDHFEAEKTPEIKEIVMMGLFPLSPSKEVFLPKGSPPAVKPENSSPKTLSCTSGSVLANNVFEDNICLGGMSKSVSNPEEQNLLLTSCVLSNDKQECPNKTSGANFGKICCSVSACEKICSPLCSLTAAEFGGADQISDTAQESADIADTKIYCLENTNIGSEILLCSKETETSGSCSLGPGSSLGKEILSVSKCEDVDTCKPVSPSSHFKDMPGLCSAASETIDVLGTKHSFSINSEDRIRISSNHTSGRLVAGSSSEMACSAPCVDLFASDVEYVHPVKTVLEKAFTVQQEKVVQRTPSEQVNLHCLIASVSENPVEIYAQSVPTLFTKLSSQLSDETLKDVETGKEVQIRSQDLAVLFKKADEIVDAVLYLAIEEIQSKETVGFCQTNDIKGDLLGPSLQKDQKLEKMSESKEILPKNLSLKHFNETCSRKLYGIQRKDNVDTDIQDEMMPCDITNKIDLPSSLALKAKEIIDDDVNVAKHKLTYSQQEENLSKGPSQTTVLMSKIGVPDKLIMDTKLTDKLSETTKESLSLSQVYSAEVHNITMECETASSLTSLHINDEKEVTREEKLPNKIFAQQNYGGKCSDSTESSPATVDYGKNSQGVTGSTHLIEVSSKVGNWTTGNNSDYSLYAGNGRTVMTREQLPSCLSLPVNVSLPAFNSNVHLSNKSEGEYSPLDLLGNDIGNDFSKCNCNYNTFPFLATEESHRSSCETSCERDYGKTEKDCTESQNKNSVSESSVKNNSTVIKPNFAYEEEQKTGVTVDDLHKENYLDGIREKSPQCFTFSLAKDWEGDSSFTILYEDSLQDDSCSSAEPEHSLPALPGLSLNNLEHLLRYEAAKGKYNSEQPNEDGSQVNETPDSTYSESFMTVEAKRYRVYPLSLSPIYEDDSSQEDLLSTDISPEGHSSEKSRDNNNPSSVLSLLQSVSERLKSTNQYFEEDEGLCEENEIEDKKETCIPSGWAGSPKTAVHERNSLSRHMPLSKNTLAEEEASPFTSVCSAQLPEKSDLDTKPFSRSVFYDYLQKAGSYACEKGARFESLLVKNDHQAKYNDLQKIGALQVSLVDREKLRCNPRPGKMVISDLKDSKNKHEIYHDELDTTTWMFSNEALIRVVRGCWMLYEKPQFQGQNFVLEEGEKLLGDIWSTPPEKHQGNFTVGSIRHVVKSCSVPEVELFPLTGTDNSSVCIQTAAANLEELEVKNPALLVKAGVWLAYSEASYKGEVMVLEENQDLYELSAADVKSLHPLRMGGLKVQMPMNVKMVIYEKPHFEGWCKELSENIDYVPVLFKDTDDFQGIGSICVIGGIWVAYEKEHYKGRQYLLEEGEYDDWQSWAEVSNVLLSFRFLQADFMESEVTLFERDEENGKLLEIVNQEIPDLDQAGFGSMTRSLNVKSGVWVAYQQKYFCGEQYVLEKGKYKCFLDWGGQNETIMSVRPVKLEPLEHQAPPHWLKAFSNTHFQGLCLDFTTEISVFTSFTPCSFKVLRGCWLLCYQGESANNQCVLEEGLYTDLASCGCPEAAIVSLRPIEYVFAESFISLFALENCEGRELCLQEAASSVLNKDLHFLTQSVWVRSGQWIAYEGSNFLGKQFLLEPGKILNWTHFSAWKAIGSLRPVKQPAIYFRIKNRSQDKYLTIAGNLTDARATSVCLSPLNGKDTQIWRYRCGLIKSKVNDACLDVIGGRDVPGAKVALWVEHGKARQKWTFNQDGTVISYLSDQLVLDIKGGYYYDRNHIVVNQLNVSECTQRWDFEIL